MAEMKWPEVEQAALEGAIVLFPLGVIEEHGPHMSLAVDILCSYLVSLETKGLLENDGIATIIAPPFYWGINFNTAAFPGSFSVRRATFVDILQDTYRSLQEFGFTRTFIINWHGDIEHNSAIVESISTLPEDFHMELFFVMSEQGYRRLGVDGEFPGIITYATEFVQTGSQEIEIHAESGETSIMGHYYPGHVDLEIAAGLDPTRISTNDMERWASGGENAREVTPLGYIGNPPDYETNVGKSIIRSTSFEIASGIEKHILNQSRDLLDRSGN
jgi:creatinine amidohydrolase